MKKYLVLPSLILLTLFLTSCGKESVKDEEIRDYLIQSYYSSHNMELESIKDITQESGETKNQIVLTCTAIAKNEYATQSSNWTITFEKFNDSWVGVDSGRSYEELQLNDEISVDDIGPMISKDYFDNFYIEVLDVQVDSESRTALVHCNQYGDYWSFYSETDVNINLCWDDSNMEWVYSSAEYVSDPVYIISSDISLNYERNTYDVSESFVITEDINTKGIYQLKDYICNCDDLFYDKCYRLDDQSISGRLKTGFDFGYDYGIGTLVAEYPVTSEHGGYKSVVRFYLQGNTLYYASPYDIISELPIKTDIQRVEPDFYNKDIPLWRGQSKRSY